MNDTKNAGDGAGERRIDRYVLHERISLHTPTEQFDGYRQFPTELWRGHDDVLDRAVSIRLIRKDDSRLNRVLGAARAAALVDDRRLLRILDVMDVPGDNEEPARTAIVSEWAHGQHLADRLSGGGLFDPTVAVQTIAEVARTLANCARHDIGHGRLRPTALLWTEAGEIRLRGLAVDAALFGPIDPAAPDADVDGLGCLLYAMTTGRWPALSVDSSKVHIPLAPAAGRTVPMPSRVRAGMPSEIDDLVTRSVRQVARPRGSMPITSVNAFTSLAGSAEDYLSPVPGASSSSVGDRLRTAATAATTAITTTSTDSTEHDSDLPRRRVGFFRFTGRLIAFAFAVALTAGIAWFGWQQIVGEPVVEEQDVVVGDSILETGAVPFVEEFDSGLTAVLPIEAVRSYDPLGDDNDDGQPDGVDGKERNKRAELAADADGTTAWLTRKYNTPTVGTRVALG